MAGSVAVYVVAVLAVMAIDFGFGSGDFGGVALRINAILSDGVADWAAVAIADALAAFAVIMVPLALTLLGVLVVVAVIHERPWRTVISARAAFDWRGFAASLGVIAGLLPIGLALGVLAAPDDVEVVFDAGRYLVFLPWVAVLLPLQVLAEEVLFRGYLLQLVSRLTHSGAIRIAAPAVVFVCAHLPNKEIDFGGVWAVLFFAVLGVYLTVLAIKGNGLEYALGFHAGLNVFALSIITSSAASMPAPTIFFDRAPNFPLGVAGMVVYCALHYRIVFALAPPRQS